MRAKSLSALLAAPAALALTCTGVASAAPAGAAEAACPGKMIFEVGGHTDKDAAVYDRSNANLPAGTGFTKIHYSASISPYPGDTVSLDDSVAEGMADLDRAVRDFHAACGGAHVTVAGYSQGAIVAGDYLAELSRSEDIPHAQINGVLYGDPRRPGAGGGPGGIETNLPTVWPGLTMKGPRGFGDLQVRELCNKNDGICYSENVITNLLGFANGVVGYFSGDHGYDIDPNAVSGSGDTVFDQPQRVPHGAPLPLPIPTLYEIFKGNTSAAQDRVRDLTGTLLPLLPPEPGRKLDEFPWLAVPARG